MFILLTLQQHNNYITMEYDIKTELIKIRKTSKKDTRKKGIYIDDFYKSATELFLGEKYGIMLLYLWMATATGKTLRQVVEEYSVERDFNVEPDPSMKEIVYNVRLKERKVTEPIDISSFQKFQMDTAEFLQHIMEKMPFSKKKGSTSL